MSLPQQNGSRSRFNPYFQTSSGNNENPQTSQANARLLKERLTGNGLYENSFINKTYHHVRSFGRDLSNIQQYQDSKQVYGTDASVPGTSGPHQPKILRVKS